MIILHEREVSNAHGSGVLLKNIISAVGSGEDVVLCKFIMNSPDQRIRHYCIDDFNLYRGTKLAQKLLLSKFGSFIYFKLKKHDLSVLRPYNQDIVFVVIYSYELLWVTLKIVRLFPEKKYVLFIMDNFIDFGDSTVGRMNKKAIRIVSNQAVLRIAISKNLSYFLEQISGHKYEVFFGPRYVDWNKVHHYHLLEKENKICLIGNVWVEAVLPFVDKQLSDNGLTITWFTSKSTFKAVKEKYNLCCFIYGGSFSSEEVIEKASTFKYGLILYGLDDKVEDSSNRNLQEFSIPSKILDYCLGGVEPLYYGPNNSACFNFLSEYKLGVMVDKSTAASAFSRIKSGGNSSPDFNQMKKVLRDSEVATFKSRFNFNI